MKLIIILICFQYPLIIYSINDNSIYGFIPNNGQWESKIAACYISPYVRIGFTREGDFIIVTDKKNKMYCVKLKHENTQAEKWFEFYDELNPTRLNYYIGNNPEKWKNGIKIYKKMKIKNLYKNIDILLYKEGKYPRFDYYLCNNARIDDIQIVISKPNDLLIKVENGSVSIKESMKKIGNVNDKENEILWIGELKSYYKSKGKTGIVKTDWDVKDTVLGFKIEENAETMNYDTLIIDPLIYSTYLGNSVDDNNRDMAVLNDESVIILGNTNSFFFPTTPGVYDDSHNGSYDLVVSKISADGTMLIFSTFIGGGGNETAGGISLCDNSNDFIICGFTNSTDFPVILPAFQNSKNSGEDGFVCKLNSNGSLLLNSTFIGGNSYDRVWDCGVNGQNEVYLTGLTNSTNYPVSAGAYDITSNGGDDIFVSKISSDFTTLLASTYYGGSCNEAATLYVDKVIDAVYITGNTCSSNFPVISGSYDDTYNGGYDCFFAGFNSNLTSLTAATFIGGSNLDYGLGLIKAMDGTFAICGFTQSNNFPITPLSYDNSFNGMNDGFVFKITPDGLNLLYSTYLGGNNNDIFYNISENQAANIACTGYSLSADYPITGNAYDNTHNGNRDVVYSRLNINLSTLLYSTFAGGAGDEVGMQLGFVSNDDVIISGTTSSANFPVILTSYDPTYNGSNDIFVFRLDDQITPLAESNVPSLIYCENNSLIICFENLASEYELADDTIMFISKEEILNISLYDYITNSNSCIELPYFLIKDYSYFNILHYLSEYYISQTSWIPIPVCIQSMGKVYIYPNPSNGIFTINSNMEVESDLSIRIINQLGITVKTYENIKLPQEIDIREFKSGIYYFISDNFIAKIIKI